MANGSSMESEPSPPSAIRWTIALATLLLPFVFVPQAFDPFQLAKEALFHVAALIVLGVWLWRTMRSGSIRLARTGLALPLLLFLFISLLSVFQAPNKTASLASFREATYSVMLFMIAASTLSLRDRLVPASLGLASLATASLGLFQILFGPRIAWLPATQGGVVIGDVTTAATFVAVLLPLLWGLASASGSAMAWVWAFGSGLAIAFVVLSRTCSAWSAAAAGALGLLALVWQGRVSRGRERSPEAASVPLLILVSVVAALAGILWGVYGTGIHLSSNPPSFKVSELEGWKLRTDAWRVTRQLILANPLGTGIGSWRHVFASEAGNAHPKTGFSASRLPFQAGNEYLQAWAEIGAVGLALLIWAVLRLFRTGWRRVRAREGFPAPACTASMIAVAAAGFCSTSLREQPLLWAATILGALVVVPAYGAERNPSELRISRWEMDPHRRHLLGYPIAFFFLCLLSLVIWGEGRALLASIGMKAGHAACGRKDFGHGLPMLLEASRLDPGSSQSRLLAAVCALEAGRAEVAEKEIRASLSLNPRDPTSWRILAEVLKERGQLTEAVASCEKARKFWPQDESINLLLGDLRRNTRDIAGALAAYQSALDGNPSSVEAYLRSGDTLMANKQIVRGVFAYTKAANLDPFSIESLSKLGDSLVKEGDYEGAAQSFENLLILSEEETTVLLRLAGVYAGLTRYCDALVMLQKARDKVTDPTRAASLDESIRKVSESCHHQRPGPRP